MTISDLQLKQERIKELEKRDEANRKARSYFNCFKTNLLKRRKESFRQSAKQESFGKTMVEI